MVCMCRPIHKKRAWNSHLYSKLLLPATDLKVWILFSHPVQNEKQRIRTVKHLVQFPPAKPRSSECQWMAQLKPLHISPPRSAPHRGPEDVLVPSPCAGQRGIFRRRTASFAFQTCFNPKSWESSIIMPLSTAGMWLLRDNRSPRLSVSNSSEVWFPNKAHAPLNSPYRCY